MANEAASAKCRLRNEMIVKLRGVVAFSLALLAPQWVAAADPVEVPLWAEGDVSGNSQVMGVDGHPCGQIALVRITRLPPLNSKPLQPDPIVEIDERGRIIRRWATPVDSLPVAISGNSLIVDLHGEIYEIDSNREIRRWKVPQKRIDPELEPLECPKVTEFGDSAYLRCGYVADRAGGKKHLLAFQGVCT